MNPFNCNNHNNHNNGNNLFNQFKTLSNPRVLFNQIANQNPQIRQIQSLINGGSNPQALFNSLCQQRGINPQEFINNLMK